MRATVAPPMLQHEGEFSMLLDLYCERRPRRVLEVGVGEGGSLFYWLEQAPAGALVVALDDRHQNRADYLGWVPYDVKLVTITGSSQDPDRVLDAYQLGPFDWIFIDADHHDQAVRADWRHFGAMAAPGGVVAFHDITPARDATIEVDRLWAELRAEHETVEFCQLADACGIGVVLIPDQEEELNR